MLHESEYSFFNFNVENIFEENLQKVNSKSKYSFFLFQRFSLFDELTFLGHVQINLRVSFFKKAVLQFNDREKFPNASRCLAILLLLSIERFNLNCFLRRISIDTNNS